MNIQEAWAYGRNSLAQASFSADLDSRLLLEFALQESHSFLIAHADDPLTTEQENLYRHLISRAQRKEPIPYITGTAEFFGLSLDVNPSVLIPRPETEQLVELIVASSTAQEAQRVVDVGTGSGCIAISLAMQFPAMEVWAVDISPAALSLAQVNAHKYVPDRLIFVHGDLLTAIDVPLDLIVANLPYVADDEWTMVDDAVKWYEPTVALSGGADGLDLIRKLLHQATSRLSPGGAIFLEIGWKQGVEAVKIARQYFPSAEITLEPDFAGHDRFLIVTDANIR